MRTLCFLLLAACSSGASSQDPLVGVDLYLDGELAPHATNDEPTFEWTGPLLESGDMPFGWLEIRPFGLQEWEVTATPPVFVVDFTTDPLFPDVRFGCNPSTPTTADGDLVLTSIEQPGRSHRTVIRCTGDADWRIGRGVVALGESGREWTDTGLFHHGETTVDYEIPLVGRVRNGADGDDLTAFGGESALIEAVFIRDGAIRVYPINPLFQWGWRSGDNLAFHDVSAGPSLMTPTGETTLLPFEGLLHYATPNGRFYVWQTGNQPVQLYVHDTETKTDKEVLDENGEPPIYFQNVEAHIALSDDGTRLWMEDRWIDRDTGAVHFYQDLIGPHYDGILALGTRNAADETNVGTFELSADGHRILLGFQTLDLLSGLFPSGNASYVIDAETEQAFFVHDATTDELLKSNPSNNGLLSPEGTTTRVGISLKTPSKWIEVTP